MSKISPKKRSNRTARSLSVSGRDPSVPWSATPRTMPLPDRWYTFLVTLRALKAWAPVTLELAPEVLPESTEEMKRNNNHLSGSLFPLVMEGHCTESPTWRPNPTCRYLHALGIYTVRASHRLAHRYGYRIHRSASTILARTKPSRCGSPVDPNIEGYYGMLAR